jgi:hypothetical protein
MGSANVSTSKHWNNVRMLRDKVRDGQDALPVRATLDLNTMNSDGQVVINTRGNVRRMPRSSMPLVAAQGGQTAPAP